MGYYAILVGDTVNGVAIADAPLGDIGQWIDVSDLNPRPGPGWKYIDGVFSEPEPFVLPTEPIANT